MTTKRCPVCQQTVPVRHNGTTPINDDGRTDPWVYESHLRDDERGGVIFRKECPTVGKNDWMARNSG